MYALVGIKEDEGMSLVIGDTLRKIASFCRPILYLRKYLHYWLKTMAKIFLLVELPLNERFPVELISPCYL